MLDSVSCHKSIPFRQSVNLSLSVVAAVIFLLAAQIVRHDDTNKSKNTCTDRNDQTITTAVALDHLTDLRILTADLPSSAAAKTGVSCCLHTECGPSRTFESIAIA